MVTSSTLGNRELSGYLAVCETLGDEDYHLSLPEGESVRRFEGRWVLRIDLLVEGVLGRFFERHRPPLCQRFFPRCLPQLRTGGSQVGLVQRPLLGREEIDAGSL